MSEEEERIREKKEFFGSSHNIKISKRRINKKLQIKKMIMHHLKMMIIEIKKLN